VNRKAGQGGSGKDGLNREQSKWWSARTDGQGRLQREIGDIMHTRESLCEQLRSGGILPADTVLVHSSMKSIGQVEGGADGVLDALMGYLGPAGLLVLPTLTYTLPHVYDPTRLTCQTCTMKPEYCLSRQTPPGEPHRFEAGQTLACIGLLPNLFWQRPGVVRSLHPTHSVAAYGRDSVAFTAGHENCASGCARHSPWHRLVERQAKILLIGVGLDTMTFLHGVTDWALEGEVEPALIKTELHVYDADGRFVPTPPTRSIVGSSRKFPLLEPALRSADAISDLRFGDASCLLSDCRQVTEVATSCLTANPRLFE